MHRDGHAEVRRGVRDDVLRVLREHAAVRIAQAHGLRPALDGRLRRAHRKGAVVEEAVEEMLGVEDHAPAVFREEAHALADHAQVFVLGRLEHVVHVEAPALAEHHAGFGAALEQGAQVPVRLRCAALAAGAAEGDELRVLQRKACSPLEKRKVLRVGARIAGLDVSDAEAVQQPHDLQLILDRKGDALALRAVPQGGVKNRHAFFTHIRHLAPRAGLSFPPAGPPESTESTATPGGTRRRIPPLKV